MTAVGAVYDLSFWLGNVVDTNGLFGVTSTVEVFVNNI